MFPICLPIVTTKQYFELAVPALLRTFPGIVSFFGPQRLQFDVMSPGGCSRHEVMVSGTDVLQDSGVPTVSLKLSERELLDTVNGRCNAREIIDIPGRIKTQLNPSLDCLHLLLNPRYIQTGLLEESEKDTGGIVVFVIDNPGLGFFATLHFCLHLMISSQSRRKRPYFVAPHQYCESADKGSWIPRFFEQAGFSSAEREQVALMLARGEVRYIQRWNLYNKWDSWHQLSFAEAASVFGRHFLLHPEIKQRLDGWVRAHFEGPVLGIHYRGTDKSTEASRVGYEEMFVAVEETCSGRGIRTLFVATDELPFREALQRRFSNTLNVVWYSVHLSDDDMPVHKKSSISGVEKGTEAMMDCLLLSQCDLVIKTASYLSAWSKLFNPRLEIYTLNYPIDLWPQWQPDLLIPPLLHDVQGAGVAGSDRSPSRVTRQPQPPAPSFKR